MAFEPNNANLIPCDICKQYFPFDQYQIHTKSHNNDNKDNNDNNNNNNNKPLSMKIPCEYASCNQEIPFEELESHLLMHSLSNNNDNNKNNNNNNNNSNENHNNNNNVKEETVYVTCTEPNCDQQIPINEIDSHLLLHQLSNNKNNNNNNNNNNGSNNNNNNIDENIIVPCDYPSCNVHVSLKDWEEHLLSHSKIMNEPQNEEYIPCEFENCGQKILLTQYEQHYLSHNKANNEQNQNENPDEKVEEKKDEKSEDEKDENKEEKDELNNTDEELKENIDITQFLCIECKQTQGHNIHCSLSHKLCIECATKYIINGIENNKWKTELMTCPSNNCKDGILPSWLINDCNLSKQQISKLDIMQNECIKFMDPTITSCPKCNETYSTEIGDQNNINNDELDANGKPLSIKHRQHKNKYRFRCSKGGCKTIFCSGCKAIPYHIGLDCDEYKQYIHAKKCRFCEIELTEKNIVQKGWFETYGLGLENVCNSKECVEKRNICCDLQYDICGHNCIGMRGYKCFQCLHIDCLPKNADITQEEYCNICWVDPLKSSPCIQLECSHYFHFNCLKQKIDKKWPAARVTFNFLNCPLCKRRVKHKSLQSIVGIHLKLEKRIEKEAINRVKIEGLDNDKRLKDSNSRYYNNINKFAMDRLAFYMCFKCKKPYFGGMKACEEAGREQEEKYNENHLICGACGCGDKKQTCNMHGTEYISWKCKYCCALAIWFCWGNTHFCDKCHKKAYQLKKANVKTLPKCKGKDKCPLGIEHPANGTVDYCLGCVVCLRK